ncbi:uncharacterized protein LOC116287462 [Actinia tenebrosa]|uniref:Uncharacterized protein LOC116287462 n=1 Tax=Actinia tenebrosa TaxID=6105 RepID=A0A6P8HBE1_ACTTE|nr:uncharacterized protein LOC116287462 [Actinia tenebrosa]
MRDPETGLNFAVFNKHEHKYLNVTPFSVISVKNPKICQVTCVGNRKCLSFNLEVKQNGERRRCELFSTDIFNSSQHFISDANFVHFSIKSSCDPIPCENGGTCVPFYTNNTHVCQCTSAYNGSACENLLIKNCEDTEESGICNVNNANGKVLQVYRHVTKDYNWTLIARFSNKDNKNWLQSGGPWWYDTLAAHGSTTDPSINEDMVSPALWSLQGREIKLTRSNDYFHTPLLQTVSNCMDSHTFRSMITSYGNFRTTTWANSKCLARCNVAYSGDYLSVIGFSWANCSGTIQDSQKIGFWCGGNEGNYDGSVMMIGGGGDGCNRADHGIAITEENKPKFGEGCDFGDYTSSIGHCSPDSKYYAINLWIRE